MKKLMITAVTALLCATTVSFAQSTTSSTDKSGTTKASGQGIKTPTPNSEKKSTDQAKQAQAAQTQNSKENKPNPTDQVAQKSAENDGSNRPGGATHQNANDVGKYSDKEDNNSMLFSKEAMAIRRKNLTESDTEMKEGSGGSERNTKNHTGTTGNYRNLATKTSGVPSSE